MIFVLKHQSRAYDSSSTRVPASEKSTEREGTVDHLCMMHMEASAIRPVPMFTLQRRD